MNVIITAPSLDPTQNVSGVSSVAQFIIDNNSIANYIHFQLGKTDHETGTLNRVSRIIRSYKEWKGFLKKHEDALIHYSFPLSAPSIFRDPVFMWYALRKKRKVVVHVHGGLFLTAPKIPWVLMRILKWVFSWDVPFIVLSDMEKGILHERFGAKWVEVLPNCPEIPEFEENKTYNESNKLVLGYLGRIEPNKGMSELLEACKVLKSEGVGFKLRFAGKEQSEGEYIPDYKNNLNENDCFEYVGLVSGKTKDAFLRSLDVFVMPTYFEGLPMSLLECMSYGVVPVVTPVGSIPEVVKSISLPFLAMEGTENGVFVKKQDVGSIVDAIKELDANRALLSQLGKNARETILSNFSTKRYVEKLNEIYGRL